MQYFLQNGGVLLEKQLSGREGFSSPDGRKIFKTKKLMAATNNFDENRIISRGGCGMVYRGKESNGREAAIKKAKIIDRKQIEPIHQRSSGSITHQPQECGQALSWRVVWRQNRLC